MSFECCGQVCRCPCKDIFIISPAQLIGVVKWRLIAKPRKGTSLRGGDKNDKMQHLAYLNKYFWKYRVRFGLGVLFIFLSNYFLSLQPQVVRQALDMVIENIALYRMYEGFGLQKELYVYFGKVLMFFGLVVLGTRSSPNGSRNGRSSP